MTWSCPTWFASSLQDATEYKMKQAGFTTEGAPDRLNIIRSLKSANARRIALSGGDRREIRALKKELREMEVSPDETDLDKAQKLTRAHQRTECQAKKVTLY